MSNRTNMSRYSSRPRRCVWLNLCPGCGEEVRSPTKAAPEGCQLNHEVPYTRLTETSLSFTLKLHVSATRTSPNPPVNIHSFPLLIVVSYKYPEVDEKSQHSGTLGYKCSRHFFFLFFFRNVTWVEQPVTTGRAELRGNAVCKSPSVTWSCHSREFRTFAFQIKWTNTALNKWLNTAFIRKRENSGCLIRVL